MIHEDLHPFPLGVMIHQDLHPFPSGEMIHQDLHPFPSGESIAELVQRLDIQLVQIEASIRPVGCAAPIRICLPQHIIEHWVPHRPAASAAGLLLALRNRR